MRLRRAAALLFATSSLAAIAPMLRTSAQIVPRGSIPRDLRLERDPIVWVPEGGFRMGASRTDLFFAMFLCQDDHDLVESCAEHRFSHERGTRRVRLPAFGIDRTEVSQAAWRRCVVAGRCVPPRIDESVGRDELPVAGITEEEAASYCAFAGGRLPAEAEWEKAARGDSLRRFPWGRLYHARLANHGRPPQRPDASDGYLHAAPVGSFPDGASPYGVLDMAGNVMEWTSSAPSARDFEALGHARADPGEYRIVRGGSWSHPAVDLRVTHRGLVLARNAHPDLGVRCAYDAR